MENQRAREDFDAARFRSFRRAVAASLTGRGRRLVSFDRVLDAARLEGRSDAGVTDIPLNEVVGSASAGAKGGDFDQAFLPTNRRLRNRWTRVYTAMTEGGELPPIDVYRLGGHYYVIDGHHRVSVARQLRRDTIPARVIDVRTRVPLGPDVDRAALLRAGEYAGFLEATELDKTRAEAGLEVSRLGRYDEILKHILGHRYFLGLERGHEVPMAESAASWYDTVFLPIAELMRRHRVLEQLHGWTEADVYVEVSRRWLQSEYDSTSTAHQAVHELLHQESGRRWKRLRPDRVG